MIVKARSPLPTDNGLFEAVVFGVDGVEHIALVLGNVAGSNVLVRIHSECLTGEAFGSLKCDCGGQLDDALERIGQERRGVLVYLRQEGRGIGLANKIRAYALQAAGADTVDANRALGLPDDARDYGGAVSILRQLGVMSARLITNNPDKCQALEAGGIPTTRMASLVAHSALSNRYLQTKRDRMHHLLPADDAEIDSGSRVRRVYDDGEQVAGRSNA